MVVVGLDSSTYWHICCEDAGMSCGNVPRRVAAHGQPRKIGALGVALKLLHTLLERCEGDRLHVGVGEDVVISKTLRHYDHEWPRLRALADGLRKPNIGFAEAVLAALAIAMQKKNDGPLLLFVPVRGKVHLEAVDLVFDDDCAVQEPCFLFVSRSGIRRECKHNDREQAEPAACMHADCSYP